MGWLTTLIMDFFYNLMIGFISVFSKFIDNIFDCIWEVNSALHFDDVLSYTGSLAIAYVSLKGIKQAFDIYVLETDGDADADPLELITRTCEAVAVIYCGSYAISMLIQMADKIAEEIVPKIAGVTEAASGNTALNIKNVIDFCYNDSSMKGTNEAFIMAILLLVMLIALVMFIFMAAKRAAELMLFQILVAPVATDLLTVNREKWNAFKSELFVCIFGYVLQVGEFQVFSSLMAMSGTHLTDMLKYAMAATGWLVCVISAPKWLEKFMYSSGVGNAAKGGIRTAGFVLPQIILRK